MNPQRWQQAKEIFYSVLEYAPEERTAFLAQACARDAELRGEVEALLESHEQAKHENFIEEPMYAVISAEIEPAKQESDASEGHYIGAYKILKEIGRGGMGRVYLATRADEVFQKQVAIKLVGRELDSEGLRRRLVHEREILASLDHPNIARLIDGGTTADGLPYFVMDYVEGVPINRYCDEHKLSITERLKLFRTLCAAVQYAHQHLVIHRDLKPANILVTADGTLKLLDFGIAKLLDTAQSGMDAHTVTQFGMMTPEYASPEQIKGEPVTTASDIYSLGVILYELLTGHRPYRIRSRRPDEIARVICEEEPEKPSAAVTRVEELAEGGEIEKLTIELIGELRSIEPRKLRRLLDGDLDNIILMAMRKEPQRRYASVEQLSEDIRRYLEGLPVRARKDSFGYRAEKFIKRNKISVTAAALTVLALLGGMAATVWEAHVARAERDRARVEAAKAARINEFLQNLFKAADPRIKGSNAKLADIVNDAAGRIDTELNRQPEVAAEAHQVIGRTYMTLSLYDVAEHQLRAAFDLNKKIYGENHPATAKSMTALGQALYGKNQFAESEAFLRRAIELQRKMGAQAERDLGETLWTLGDMLRLKGDYKSAEPLLQESLETFRRAEGDDHEDVANGLVSLALMREAQGDVDGAETLYRQSIAILRKLPERRRITIADPLSSLTYLGTILTLKGKYDEAEADLNEIIDFYRRLGSDQSPALGRPLRALAYLHLMKGDLAKAEQEINSAISIQRKLPAGNPDLSYSLYILGLILMQEGKPVQAEARLREALNMRSGELRQGNIARMTEGALGACLMMQKRYSEAEPLLTESYNALKSNLGAQHPVTVETLRQIVKLYEGWRKPDQAAQYRMLLHS